MLTSSSIGAIGGILIMPKFMQDYGIDVKEKDILSENIVSTLQAGCFVASLLAGPFSDKYGRRWSLIISAIITCVGIALQAAPTLSLPILYVGRLVAGFGVGAASMLTPLYVSECAPRAIRGALTGCYQLFIVNGVMLSFWVNYATQYHWEDRNVYLIPLSLQAVPAICMIVGMLWCPESPRWTAKMDDWERTTYILSKLTNLPEDHEYIDHELYGMAEQLEIERRLVGDATTWILLKEMWLIRGNRNRALISIGLMVCQQMTGVNAINYYAPQMFQALGMNSTESSLFATGIYGVVKVIPPFGYVALVCIFLFAAFFQFGWGPCCWIYVSEIPSARLRAMNVAQAAATQWLFNFVVARTVPTMMKNMGYAGYGTYFLFGSFCASMFFFAYFLIPETKGMSLEKMDELFGITDMLRVMQDMEHRRPYSHRSTAEYELKEEDKWQRLSG
ncbi:hypothetical protein JX265_004072 [Neoarthrinium moseri]|uniref:Major facilitator superfamily (MFS) profile domain-containing protein n=1 Tax=Neoarthrinium moseri TaxID=1658444 RepID=A0A9P9WRU9_9PEZI|nr:hypothetical protein JX265_004072 [Neoarthrinium moseri]